MKKQIPIIVLAALLIAGFAVVLFGGRVWTNRREHVIIGPGTADPVICISPDNSATRAAANYLSLSVERSLGRELDIVTETKDNQHTIRILSEEDDALLSEEEPVCTLALEGENVVIRVPRRNHCFEAVKAVTDRWLQKDCGLKREGELHISWTMMERDLSWLSTAIPDTFRILSQNLCYSDDGPGRSVEERAERFFLLLEEQEPDLIGTQECTPQWKELLTERLGDRYEFYGSPRDGQGRELVAWDAILYRKERFTLLDGGTFWLSNTPDVPKSQLNYDGANRLCTWVLLADRETGKSFLYSNTHLHVGGGETCARQVEILLRYLRQGNNYLERFPGFLTGDFNSVPQDLFYKEVTAWYQDARTTAVNDRSSVDYTYQGYGTAEYMLDYCFHSPRNVTVLDYRILDDLYGGDYVSDHFGLLVTAVVN